ncbi:hypothetical protein HELRODRAFT_182008 [Helobdella robusta]|uniref:Tetraspanin n=1 Tax=Helobdella robusta TaxID=6412 RepID=T1FHL1_HELRO|nr:hypothetical protein HELRODRAFT_182008 [Helobdella robusta]ESN91834.1 hypothetical protein HELRODRAFT_182008 [Helobdella robusta]
MTLSKKEREEKEARERRERDERIGQMKANLARKKLMKVRRLIKVPKEVTKKKLLKIKGSKDFALRTTKIKADTLKKILAKEKQRFSAKVVKVQHPAMTFSRRWKLLESNNQLFNYARWLALIIAYCFVNLSTLFLAAYSYFMTMSEPYIYMENFVSFGREHGQNLVFFCIQSAIVSFHGFCLSCAAVDVVRRNNLRFFAIMYLIHSAIHLIFLLIVAIFYIVAWLHVRRFMQNGDYLYDPLRLYTEEQDIFISINEFQMKYGCCGVKSYLDWARVRWWTGEYSQVKKIKYMFKVPFSCCDQDLVRAGTCIWFAQSTIDLTINRHGCRGQVKEFLKSELFVKMVLLVVMTVCHIICFVFLLPSVLNLPHMELLIFRPPPPKPRDKDKERLWITNTLAQLFSKSPTAVRTTEAQKLAAAQQTQQTNAVANLTGAKALVMNLIQDREKLDDLRHDFKERQKAKERDLFVKDMREAKFVDNKSNSGNYNFRNFTSNNLEVNTSKHKYDVNNDACLIHFDDSTINFNFGPITCKNNLSPQNRNEMNEKYDYRRHFKTTKSKRTTSQIPNSSELVEVYKNNLNTNICCKFAKNQNASFNSAQIYVSGEAVNSQKVENYEKTFENILNCYETTKPTLLETPSLTTAALKTPPILKHKNFRMF